MRESRDALLLGKNDGRKRSKANLTTVRHAIPSWLAGAGIVGWVIAEIGAVAIPIAIESDPPYAVAGESDCVEVIRDWLAQL
jgi:hypothetical protein